MYISTRGYVNAHGKTPRGQGSWAFNIDDDSSNTTVETVFFTGTYAQAKKQAIQYVKDNYAAEINTGYLSISVGS